MSDLQPPQVILDPSEFHLDRPLPLNALFARPQPVEIDIGCGKGRFLRARALKHPHTNFLGVDRMHKRMLKVDKKIRREALTNVRLIQIEAAYLVANLLPPASIAAYYIFFPDPWPKRRHHRRRLFSPPFVDALHRSLVAGGGIHVATDHLEYFEAIHAVLRSDSRFEETDAFVPEEDEKTNFEMLFLGLHREIGRCSFSKQPVA